MRIVSAIFLSTAAFALPAETLAQDRTLTVYTYESFTAEWGPGPIVKEAFESQCDCRLEWVAVADGVALLNRLLLEGDQAKAGVVLGLDTNLVVDAKQTGLFTPHEIDTTAVDVPGNWSDDTFVPYDYGHFAVVYDTEAIENPPTSLKELVEGDPDEKIAIQDPRSSTPGLGLLLWMKSVYGEDAVDAWADLKDRVLTVAPGWSEAYGLFTDGEVPMVLSYTTSPAYHMIAEDTDRYQAAAFDEGHYLQIEVAGILKNAPDPELARDFLRFMITEDFQDAIPTSNWMMPAGPVSQALPDAFAGLVTPEETLLFTPEEVAQNRRAWVDEWLAVMSE
ncbi:thiamine ABC transporter substrate binding subunit [Pararhizobium haloflavum]|uniref:thiamine ABC transporter substrate binding subunit n=1 Tax=Pararhizobium haloflavum TaxID=2037914 RepID=UPI000C1A32F9